MRVTVRCFAALREAAGREVLEIELEPGSDVSGLRASLQDTEPGLASLLPSVAVAVNQRLVRDDHVLAPDDEIALLPPVSGG